MSAESEGHNWNTAFKTADDAKLLKAHIDEYARMTQICVDKVTRLWNEVGLPRGDRQKEFDEVATAVRNVWSATVDRAERKKRERQKEIEEAVSEIYRIKEELGDCTRDSRRQGIEGLLRLEMIVGSSLHTRYEAIQDLLRDWRKQRGKREVEFKELQSEINNLKLRFGEVVIAPSLSPCKSDVSLANLQKLSEELEQCKAEKLRRERELAAMLSKLRSVCVPLGENDVEIAAAAHPSLKFYREALPGHFSLVRPSYSNQPGLQRNIRPEDVELDLSDQTFAILQEKILEVYDLRDVREKQTTEVAGALKYLWDMLEIPEDDLDRGMLVRCLEGATRLHTQSIERCRNEIRQLETSRASQLWELIHRAKEELEDVCEETMVPMPQLCPLLTIDDFEDENNKPVGKLSDALAKLKKTIDETRELSDKRAPIIQQITQLEHARVEVEWLTEYELDADRYKGRDLSKKLDRALKAGRMRDKFPEMIKRLKKSVCKWEQDERRSFVYRGQDYSVVLEDMLSTLDKKQQPPAAKPTRRNSRRPVSRNTMLTPPTLVTSPPTASMGDLTASGGSPMEPTGSANRLSTQGRTLKEDPVSQTRVSAPVHGIRYAPDGELDSGFNGRQRSSSALKPPRAGYPMTSELPGNVLPTSPGGYGSSPRFPHGQAGSSSNRSPRTSLFSEDSELARTPSKRSPTSKMDFLLTTDSRIDYTFFKSNLPRESRSSKGGSPYGDLQGRGSGSTSNRGTRSTGSSRLSGSLEDTERKPS